MQTQRMRKFAPACRLMISPPSQIMIAKWALMTPKTFLFIKAAEECAHLIADLEMTVDLELTADREVTVDLEMTADLEMAVEMEITADLEMTAVQALSHFSLHSQLFSSDWHKSQM